MAFSLHDYTVLKAAAAETVTGGFLQKKETGRESLLYYRDYTWEKESEKIDEEDIPHQIDKLRSMMSVASSSLDFETAIRLRDRITELRRLQDNIHRAKKQR